MKYTALIDNKFNVYFELLIKNLSFQNIYNNHLHLITSVPFMFLLWFSSMMHTIGNVRGVLVRANKAYTLTKDHTPKNEKEKNRVIKAGQ